VPAPAAAGDIDLGANVTIAIPDVTGPLVRRLFEQLEATGRITEAFDTATAASDGIAIDVARRWLSRISIERDAQVVTVAPGFHPALLAVVTALTSPGDVIAAESVAYTGLSAVARIAGTRLEGVAVDAGGLVAEDLAAVCANTRPRLLIVQPTHHSPTTVTWSEARRREILAIAARHDVLVVEFDEDMALHDPPVRPLATLAPERVVCVADVGRALGLGLRVCAVTIEDRAHRDAIDRALLDVAWMTPTLAVAWTDALLTDDGSGGLPADTLIDARKGVLAERQARAARLDGLGNARLTGAPHAHHVWIDLSETSWTRSEAFVAAAAERHVIVSDAHAFHIGRRPAPNAIRLALGPPNDEQLDEALTTLAELLARPPTGRTML
jgi:DNA-binding transcriptional MocR family regulator